MKIVHLSAECYPVAKVGGLADVVGALPKYQIDEGVSASVIMPKYANDWIEDHQFKTIYEDHAPLGDWQYNYSIQREEDDTLGFPLYMVDIPTRFNRPGIYAEPQSGTPYQDEIERFTAFQVAALDWLSSFSDSKKPDVIHCHDHHVGLIPFMLTKCDRYRGMRDIPTVLTVHNGEYHGVHPHEKKYLLPRYDHKDIGLLDWDGKLNCLAAGLKTCWEITTVSPSYMDELSRESHGLESLFKAEQEKSRGIINGIDTDVWDPKTDPMIDYPYTRTKMAEGKRKNKKKLCDRFGLDPQYPTISYIGRLAYEKGADLLPDLFRRFLESTQSVNFIVLGTGDRNLHHQFEAMSSRFVGYFDAALDYNEPLAHKIYAGSDFMMMPSRVEPCGLNQMYSMRYGTVPIVRTVGGLRDTVVDLGAEDGYGITFFDFSLQAAADAIQRAIDLYEDGKEMTKIRKKVMNLDFSWNASAKEYIKLYTELTAKK
ncbi:glycogen synthase [Fodinibius salsisoli]|uniref:Glycogen synthase n=1 Tax=Fodinibius salsisoli TaxID=2820877 RepID=A0ABT3PL19_9BACT|nr:glycogen synthase [Fodinibius salsisoli]MCW9706640.1 glycogen synthase [Fodinibius salsisoli]